ncbi:MAG: hypothetical protein HKP27_00340 [Myxococcales bacterium]|nr:hypothetical protein [Myxococcales bacterium]
MAAITYRPTLAHLAVVLALAVMLIAYPFIVDELLSRFGVRAVALAGLASLVLGFFARRGTSVRANGRRDLGISAAALGAGFVTGEPRFLLLLPALINLQIYFVCRDSLREDPSVIERMARYLQPRLPEFTRGYCRACTRFWAGFFAANVAVISALAFFAPLSVWRVYTGPVYVTLLSVLGLAEFLCRKIYFRYYADNWFDRLFSTWFPAEATARGRRSAAYIASFSSGDARENDARNSAS